MVDVVVFHHMIIAVDPNYLMGAVIHFVVSANIANALEQHSGTIGFIYLRPAVDQIVLHNGIARR